MGELKAQSPRRGCSHLPSCSALAEAPRRSSRRGAAVRERRPDLLAATTAGVSVVIEIAYSPFCDFQKRQDYDDMRLPVLEIDQRAFTPRCGGSLLRCHR